MKGLNALALMALAMGIALPFPERKEREAKSVTKEDMDRIEAARLKRERKARKRVGQ